MSTYESSKYRKARKRKQCVRCDGEIRVGERYLAFKPGLRSNCPVCYSCSVQRDTWGQPVYWCREVSDEFMRRSATAV